MPDSDTIRLACLLEYEDEPFDVEVKKDSSVYSLKVALQERLRLDIDARDLRLWKVSIHCCNNDALKAVVLKHDPAKGVYALNAGMSLGSYFPTEPEKDHIHIVVQFPQSGAHSKDEAEEARDIVTSMSDRVEGSLRQALLCRTPSTSAKSGGYRDYQGKRYPIYDGRYAANNAQDTKSLSVQLYHPAFGHFLDDIANENIEVPPDVIRATARLMDCASAIHDSEADRISAINPYLMKAMSVAMGMWTNPESTTLDGMVATPLQGDITDIAALCICEDKNEIGDGSSDPSIQAGLSYARYWAQEGHEKIRRNSCCPSFLLAHAGPWFCVLGAVIADKIMVQRLTDFIWVGIDTIFNEPSVIRIARIFYALGKNVDNLRDYYNQLKDQLVIGRKLRPSFFPSICSYIDQESEKVVEFTYVKPLEWETTCSTFLAQIGGTSDQDSGKHIVVKFVHRYNKKAHELLAENRMAPKLLYCGKVGIHADDPSYGHLRMVIMDFVDGAAFDHVKHDSADVVQKLKTILALLHDAGFVFGDLRPLNVMVMKDSTVILIDFDWVGEDGESRYPIDLSQTIAWSEGVKEGLGVMKKEHDNDMLERLF